MPTEVTLIDQLRAAPSVKQQVRQSKQKVKHTARQAKHDAQPTVARAKGTTQDGSSTGPRLIALHARASPGRSRRRVAFCRCGGASNRTAARPIRSVRLHA